MVLKPKRVLEWGPGVSTRTILRCCPDAYVRTIEHDHKYAEKARQEFGALPNVEVVEHALSMKGGRSTGYITDPLRRKLQGIDRKGFDLIFIDGRSRLDCAAVAACLAKKRTVVMIHDSHRQNYHEACSLFAHSADLGDLRTLLLSDSDLAPVLQGFDADAPNRVLSDAETMDDLSRRFLADEPFCYLRFGDADLFFIEDPSFDRNKRHDPNPEMSRELAEAFALEDPQYLIGCVAGGKVFKRYDASLRSIAQTVWRGKTFHSAVSFHSLYAAAPDAWEAWVRAVFHRPGKRVLLVGGESICRAPLVRRALNVTATIPLTDRNAYQTLDARTMAKIEKNVGKYDIIIGALGQATRVLGWRLWSKGLRTQFFDVGSTVDALANRPLRSWIRRLNDELLPIYEQKFPE